MGRVAFDDTGFDGVGEDPAEKTNCARGWAPETARREAKVQLGRVAGGDDPVEDRQLDHRAITVKELCTRYLADLQAGLILGKGGRPKKASTIVTDTGRIERHIIPLIGTRRVAERAKARLIA